jgi:hypothetical protein
MAKGNPGAEDRAKVKLRVIEFELEGSNASVENSIRQLTAALTTRNGTAKPAITPKAKELSGGAATEPEEAVDADVIEPDENESETPAASPKTPRPKAKPKPPTYLPTMLTKDKLEEFKAFAAKKTSAMARRQQYLVAAFWMKEHGGDENVNADKVYTLFKTAGWPTNFNDWRMTFDNLVYSEHLRKVGKGEFAINPLGEDEVNNMS